MVGAPIGPASPLIPSCQPAIARVASGQHPALSAVASQKERLDWLQKQAKGATIYAERMREQGDEEAAAKADAAAADANAELEKISARLNEAVAGEEKKGGAKKAD